MTATSLTSLSLSFSMYQWPMQAAGKAGVIVDVHIVKVVDQ